jgi:hypothetical protein
MPHVIVKLYSGRSDEQEESARGSRHPGCDKDAQLQ